MPTQPLSGPSLQLPALVRPPLNFCQTGVLPYENEDLFRFSLLTYYAVARKIDLVSRRLADVQDKEDQNAEVEVRKKQ